MHWLYRSGLRNYGRHAVVFHKILAHTLETLDRVRLEQGDSWISGFDIYDRLDKERKNWSGKGKSLFSGGPTDGLTKALEGIEVGGGGKNIGELRTWKEFTRIARFLVSALARATPDTKKPLSGLKGE